MPDTNQGGRPTAIKPADRAELRKAHGDFIKEWSDRLRVGHNTIRRALANTKKGPGDSTATIP